MQIVGFGGLAQAGKTTAANILAEWAFNRGYHVVMDGFAAPLKKASALLGFIKGGDTDHLYRAFCQTEGARARDEDVDWFVNLMAARLDVAALEEQNMIARDNLFHETLVLIDDVRFLNEVEILKRYKARTVFICGLERLSGDLKAEWRQHVSEQLAFDYSAGVINDNTFDFTVPNNKVSVDGDTFPALEAYMINLAPTLAALDAVERLHE